MDCYVEFYDLQQAMELAGSRNNRLLKSRRAEVTLSSQSELLADLFPKWKGNWRGIRPIVTEQMICSGTVLAGYVTIEELSQLLAHARTYRVSCFRMVS